MVIVFGVVLRESGRYEGEGERSCMFWSWVGEVGEGRSERDNEKVENGWERCGYLEKREREGLRDGIQR